VVPDESKRAVAERWWQCSVAPLVDRIVPFFPINDSAVMHIVKSKLRTQEKDPR
jgi:hypothetical protein